MPIGDVCIRDVAVTNKSTTIREAAALMRQYHVGDLIVTLEDGDGRKIPVGIVTDRDIVVSVIALELDPAVYTVGDLVAREVISVSESTGVFECIQRMRTHGVRRMPVIGGDGGLIGIVSVDDLIQLLSEEMSALAKLISRERVREAWIKK